MSVAVLGGREPPPGGGGGGDAPPAGVAVLGRPRAAIHPPTARRPRGEGEGPRIGDGADPRAGGGGGVRCLLPHQMARTIGFRKTGMDLIRTSESSYSNREIGLRSKEQRYSKRRTTLKQEKEDVIWEMNFFYNNKPVLYHVTVQKTVQIQASTRSIQKGRESTKSCTKVPKQKKNYKDAQRAFRACTALQPSPSPSSIGRKTSAGEGDEQQGDQGRKQLHRTKALTPGYSHG